MGAGREDAAALTRSTRTRAWPLVIRRATEQDHDAVLAFASGTWEGWDYIPNAWPVWLHASDGAFLVGTVGESPGAGREPLLDAEGSPLDVGQVVAITRVAMVSESEAWLEGIRVDPRVRGMGVAADLQVAELQWVAAQRADVVRYATGGENEASHRLGARDGIKVIARFRGWWWSATGSAEDDDHDPSAFEEAIHLAATERRREALKRLGEARMIVAAERDDIDDLWRRLTADPTFTAGQRLFEARSWAMAELTEAAFRRHVERGEVVVSREPVADGGWAIAILVGEQLPSEDSALRLALLCGDGPSAAALADEIRRLAGHSIRFRVPAEAPMITGHEKRFREAGFVTRDWEMHLLARQMHDGQPIPAADPARLVLADTPARIEPPRW
ncbi:MAG: hypothetical protein WD830_00130 [Chloroflexota bacterium]